jgi:uncharacterized protein YbjQ (UPF0145 family)
VGSRAEEEASVRREIRRGIQRGLIWISALSITLVAPSAVARNDLSDFDVAAAKSSAIGEAKLLDVPFYMAGQPHPKVAKSLGTFTSNKKTNAFGKADEEACTIAFLSAVIQLQTRAKKLGGDAVVDIKSFTKNQDLESATQYRCAAGNVIANVALTGRVVKLRK